MAALAIAGLVVFLLTRDGDDVDSSIPPATEEPDGLGDDAGFDALAEDCFDGDMQACDDLYNRAEDDSAYRRYGDTCAGRQPEGTRQFCTATFPDRLIAGGMRAPIRKDRRRARRARRAPVPAGSAEHGPVGSNPAWASSIASSAPARARS